MSSQALIASLSERFTELHPGEAARLLEEDPHEDVVRTLSNKPSPVAARVLEAMDPRTGALVIRDMEPGPKSALVAVMEVEELSAMLAWLTPEEAELITGMLPARAAGEVRELMSYPEGVAGHIMDPRVVTFREDATVGESLKRLRKLPYEDVEDVFLVDDAGKLTGAIDLQRVAIARPERRLEEIAVAEPPAVAAMGTVEEVVELLAQSRQSALPVISIDGRIVGVIRHVELFSAAEEEASADLQTTVGAGKEERALSPPSLAIRKRLPWLQINLATAFLAAAVVGAFESTIAKFTALAVLLPVVAGQSGNTGGQALAVALRGLALREIRISHWPKMLAKETWVAFINGLAVALTTSIGVLIWSSSIGLAVVIAIAMVISMVIAGMAGASIPILLKSMGLDPAQSSTILLTTVTDVVGFLTFLGLASAFSSIL